MFTIHVLHSASDSVRDVQLSPSLTSYPPGSSITCSAKGYPLPTFNWQKLEDDNVTWVDIPNLTGNEFILNYSSSNWYRCVAMNNIREINYNNTSDEFQINNTSNGKPRASSLIQSASFCFL